MSRYSRRLPSFVLLCCLPVLASAEVTAKLEILVPRTLPGLSVPLKLTLENRGTTDVVLADRVVYPVRESDGTAYVTESQPPQPPHVPLNGLLFPDDEQEGFTLKAGEKLEVWMPTSGAFNTGPDEGPYAPAEVWLDNRVMMPGRRFLRLKLGGSPNTPWILSNEAELLVEEPTSIDAVVWRRMQELWNANENLRKKPFPWAPGWAKEVVTSHPDSSYFAVAALMIDFGLFRKEERVELLERALATNPSPLIRDSLRGAICAIYASIARDHMSSGRLDEALDYVARARAVLIPLEKDSAFRWIRDGAAAALDARRTDQEVIDEFRTHYALTTTTNAIRARPFVDCIWPADRGFIALFGFENGGDGGKYLPVGTGNRFKPGDADRGQPRWFPSGVHHHVAGAVSDNGQPVEWQLDGNAAVATAEFPNKCAGEVRPVRPVVECANNDNEGVVVTFGYDNPNPFPVRVDIGEENRFDGASSDRGQPTVFEPGRRRAVFKVRVTDAPVTWTLAGRRVTAKPRHPVVCAR